MVGSIVVNRRKNRQNPTATAMGIATVWLRFQRNSKIPIKKSTRAIWRRSGSAVKICGRYHRLKESTFTDLGPRISWYSYLEDSKTQIANGTQSRKL